MSIFYKHVFPELEQLRLVMRYIEQRCDRPSHAHWEGHLRFTEIKNDTVIEEKTIVYGSIELHKLCTINTGVVFLTTSYKFMECTKKGILKPSSCTIHSKWFCYFVRFQFRALVLVDWLCCSLPPRADSFAACHETFLSHFPSIKIVWQDNLLTRLLQGRTDSLPRTRTEASSLPWQV